MSLTVTLLRVGPRTRATGSGAKGVPVTAVDAILLACHRHYLVAGVPIHEAELTVQAWRLDRKALGLRGYEQSHPDHRRAVAAICKVLVPQGFLFRPRQCYYQPTGTGRLRAAAIEDAIRKERAT